MDSDTVLRSKAGTSLAACTRRIGAVYRLASADQLAAGSRWYADGARVVDQVADAGRIDRERAAVIVAHLSPRTTWSRNVAGALQLVQHGRADYCMGANITRAMLALTMSDPWTTFGPDARKIKRFALNLLGRKDVVTVDVWAARVALGRGWGPEWRTGADDGLDVVMGRVGVYEALETAYLNAARRIGAEPPAVQAATWIVARNGRAQ